MGTILRSFYHNLAEPIVICDLAPSDGKNSTDFFENSINSVYFNRAFKKVFEDVLPPGFTGDISDKENGIKILKKLDYKFYFEFCLIESENLKTYSPLKEAFLRKGNCSLWGMYQKSEREFLYFLIHAFSLKKYRVLYFYDITNEVLIQKLSGENERLKIENREFLNTNSKAQNQAVKMALLNRVMTGLSKTIDLNDLINTALNELGIIFGAKKVYFAKRSEDNQNTETFETEYVYPFDRAFLGCELKYDKLTTDEILDNKISIQTSLKESENAPDSFKSPHTRIILPIFDKGNLRAIVVILTPKKNIEDIEKELLIGISMQISSAITQAMLFRAVSDKKEELQSALLELKETQLQLINSEKMASLGQLIASVAHEINTPLASICANNEIAKRFFDLNLKTSEAFDEDTMEILRDTNSIDCDAIKRITNLVQSLKRFVRLDEMTSQAANINEELDLTLNLLRHKLKKDIKLNKKYGDIPLVECYPNMLNQVFLNILMNSIQSIEKRASVENAGLGGAVLGAGPGYFGEITISTEILDNNLIIKIQDNGFGIKDEDKKKIFHAGFTTKKVGEGTGLGLAICKKIIEKHNGEINFNSVSYKTSNGTIEKTTVFEIKLPV